jgi:hypothetical protein
MINCAASRWRLPSRRHRYLHVRFIHMREHSTMRHNILCLRFLLRYPGCYALHSQLCLCVCRFPPKLTGCLRCASPGLFVPFSPREMRGVPPTHLALLALSCSIRKGEEKEARLGCCVQTLKPLMVYCPNNGYQECEGSACFEAMNSTKSVSDYHLHHCITFGTIRQIGAMTALQDNIELLAIDLQA